MRPVGVTLGETMRKKTNLGMIATAVALAIASATPRAEAQTNADKAAAEALFQAGRTLMDQGKYADACTKLEASQRLDSGLGTLLYLAECYEKAGRLASAWANFREAESIAMGRGDQGRATIARQRYSAIEPRLSKLWIKVADGNDPATQVKRDGEDIPRASWGLALPIDAGDHTINAMAPGRKLWSTQIVVAGEGANVPVEIPVLEVVPAAAPPPAPRAPTPAPGPSPKDHAPGGSDGLKPVALVLGGVGVAGLALGSYFGLRAKAKNTDSLSDCEKGNTNLCTQAGVDLRNEALSSARTSTAFLIGGGALLAGGVVLYLIAPSSKSSTGSRDGIRIAASGAPGGGNISVLGAF